MAEEEEKKDNDVENDAKGKKVFLVMADDSDEFDLSLRIAAKLAISHNGKVGIFYSASDSEFQHWGGVQNQMRKEIREKAEKFVWEIAKKVKDIHNTVPAIYIEIGDKIDMLVKTINSDNNIALLVVAVGKSKENAALFQKISTRVNVPVLKVPAVTEAAADDIVSIFD